MDKSNILFKLICAVSAAALLASCGLSSSGSKDTEDDLGVEGILKDMKSDPQYQFTLDSLAQIYIGQGARTVDVLNHMVSYQGRLFMYNTDWGTVFELPTSTDWKPNLDTWQAVVSFHGNSVWSADSLALVSYYGGFQVLYESDIEEYISFEDESLEEDGFKVLSRDIVPITIGGADSYAIITQAKNDDGINYYRKDIIKDHNNVNHAVTVQWPDGYDMNLIGDVKKNIDKFPYGPEGQLPNGYCL